MTVRCFRIAIMAAVSYAAAVIVVLCPAWTAIPEADPLARGIELYTMQRYDEALDMFRDALEMSGRCPLALYYTARIRFLDHDYSGAVNGIESATGDSAGFHDARGFYAFLLKEAGERERAVEQWRLFVQAVNPDDVVVPHPDSIVPPEVYRRQHKLGGALPEYPGDVPVPVIEFIARRNTGQSPSGPPEPSWGFPSAKVIAYCLIAIAGLLALFVLKKRRTEPLFEETTVVVNPAPKPSAYRQPESDSDDDYLTVTDDSVTDSAVKASGPRGAAQRLSKEREMHKREIERLLRKV